MAREWSSHRGLGHPPPVATVKTPFAGQPYPDEPFLMNRFSKEARIIQ